MSCANGILTRPLQFKKAKRTNPDEPSEKNRTFLSSVLSALLLKMKWDEDIDFSDFDEEDKQAFDSLRKVSSPAPSLPKREG